MNMLKNEQVLLMEEILHQLIGSLSQVVQGFFHQQYQISIFTCLFTTR